MKEDNFIKIKNYEELNTNYKIYPKREIEGKSINVEYENNLSNLIEKDGLTLMIMHQTKIINMKSIKYEKMTIRLVKFIPENKNIQTDIEINKEKIFEYFPNFYHYDIFRVNDKISFLFVCLFNEFYYYKIIEKEDDDDYKIEYVELYNESIAKLDKSINHLYFGNCLYKNNILEYVFLEKPGNYFLYFIFNLSSLEIETKEIECKIIQRNLDKSSLEKYKINKLRKGFNSDKFLFIENDSFQLIVKDNNNESQMLIYPLKIDYHEKNIIKEKFYFLKILDKNYFILDAINLDNSTKNKNNIIIVTFEIYFDEKNKIFKGKLLQEINIKINSKDGKYTSNCNINNMLIVDDNTLFYIILNDNCLAESIYLFNKSHSKKYYLNDDEKYFHIYSMDQRDKYVSFIKINKVQLENKQDIEQVQEQEQIQNNSNIDINNLNIESIIKNKILKLMQQNRDYLEKENNKIKDKIRGEKTEIEKYEKKVEKLSIQAVEDIEDIPEEKKLNKYENNSKEKKHYYNNNYKKEYNYEQKWSNDNKINYQKRKNNNKYYYYNNNNYNQINNQLNNQSNGQFNNQINFNLNKPNFQMNNNNNFPYNNNNNNNYMMNNFNNQYNVNPMNNINIIQQLNKLNPNTQFQPNNLNQINQMNNIQNQSMINNFNNNPQMYQNFNPNF